MLPFGKQQESLNFLSATNPEELSGNRRTLLIEDDAVCFSNEKSTSVRRSVQT
jgi:hypothetical protein